MIIRKPGIWKDEYLVVSKEAAEQMMQQDPSLQMVPEEQAPQISGAQLQEVAKNALLTKPADIPETETAGLDRQAGQLRAETDRMKAQTNLAKAQSEYDKSFQALQAAQQPPMMQQQQMPGMQQQPQTQPQPMANLTAADPDIIVRLRKRMDERRANGRFASAQQIANKPITPKTASERLHEIIEGKKSRPFQK